jgi:hypothetical protein
MGRPGRSPGIEVGSVREMRLGDLLEEKTDAIVGRWGDAVLSAYPADAATIFRTQQDPFANPLGHGVREGTRGVFRVLLQGMADQEELRTHLDRIIRVRAVQDLTPARALEFVFSLRAIVREVIPEAEARHSRELADLDRKIDQVALAAFEVYQARREELSELRIREVKRQVSWVLGKMNGREDGTQDRSEDSMKKTSAYDNVHREDL